MESPNAPCMDMDDIRDISVSFHCSPTPEMPAPESRIIFAGTCWAAAMMKYLRAVKVFMRRRSGQLYAGALSSAVVDGGTGAVTDVDCGSLRYRYSF